MSLNGFQIYFYNMKIQAPQEEVYLWFPEPQIKQGDAAYSYYAPHFDCCHTQLF